jgi:hypothetical protein
MHVITVHNPEKFKRPSWRWRKSLENLQRVPHTKSVNRLYAQVTTSMISVRLLNVLRTHSLTLQSSHIWVHFLLLPNFLTQLRCQTGTHLTRTAFAKLAHQASRWTTLDAGFNLLTDLHTHTGPVRIFRKCPVFATDTTARLLQADSFPVCFWWAASSGRVSLGVRISDSFSFSEMSFTWNTNFHISDDFFPRNA